MEAQGILAGLDLAPYFPILAMRCWCAHTKPEFGWMQRNTPAGAAYPQPAEMPPACAKLRSSAPSNGNFLEKEPIMSTVTLEGTPQEVLGHFPQPGEQVHSFMLVDKA